MTNCTKEELLAEQHNEPAQLEVESNAWWAAFIELWADRGADRKDLNAAVEKFRAAQKSLGDALGRQQVRRP